MRKYYALILLLLSFNSFGQIKIDDVGDGWKAKVDSALVLIKTVDPDAYQIVLDHCNHITYWMNKFSSTQDPSTILIATKDMALSVNNIACVIVHESYHLRYRHFGVIMGENDEEYMCYRYEYKFALKIPNVEPWLIQHAIINMRRFQTE